MYKVSYLAHDSQDNVLGFFESPEAASKAAFSHVYDDGRNEISNQGWVGSSTRPGSWFQEVVDEKSRHMKGLVYVTPVDELEYLASLAKKTTVRNPCPEAHFYKLVYIFSDLGGQTAPKTVGYAESFERAKKDAKNYLIGEGVSPGSIQYGSGLNPNTVWGKLCPYGNHADRAQINISEVDALEYLASRSLEKKNPGRSTNMSKENPPSLASLKRTARECAEKAVCQAHVDPDALPKSENDLRDIYRKVRSDSPLDMEAFDASAKALLVAKKIAKPTPTQWVKAALSVRTECDKCHGSGTYGWGAFINGKPTFSGPCYACEGKGVQRHDDWVRNANYWRFFVKLQP